MAFAEGGRAVAGSFPPGEARGRSEEEGGETADGGWGKVESKVSAKEGREEGRLVRFALAKYNFGSS